MIRRCWCCGFYAQDGLLPDPLCADNPVTFAVCKVCVMRRLSLARRMDRTPFVVVRPDGD